MGLENQLNEYRLSRRWDTLRSSGRASKRGKKRRGKKDKSGKGNFTRENETKRIISLLYRLLLHYFSGNCFL